MSAIRCAPISRGTRTEPPPPTNRPALPLGQRVERARLGHPQVRGRRQLQPAADHRALEHGDHRDACRTRSRANARCHIRECCSALERVALGQLGEVEPGAEVVALGVAGRRRARPPGGAAKNASMPEHGRRRRGRCAWRCGTAAARPPRRRRRSARTPRRAAAGPAQSRWWSSSSCSCRSWCEREGQVDVEAEVGRVQALDAPVPAACSRNVRRRSLPDALRASVSTTTTVRGIL